MPSLITRLRRAILADVFRRGTTRRVEAAAPQARANANRRRQVLSVYNPEFSGLHVHDGNDGAWWCDRCGQQNLLKIQQGRHPFGQLSCARCNHIFNQIDVSTNVMCDKVIRDDFHPDRYLVPEGKACGVVCPGCGSTHLGVRMAGQDVPWYSTYDFSRIKCHCGRRGGGEWLNSWYCFCVGSCRDWHEDRVGAEGKAMEERLERRFQTH
ncbi:hypothetical protein P171DRAFT_488558 [Karstenula rhodostoma CBS 690.94]|uniref:Probable double zinc ribbon domain-containing protein n=1 Tax=Karstenula rhodostoma CBS 690.94 TaxID=1392251 RepID=A0A9P4P9P6_9PLEO|nr:hypothetical protein P171DRAFT_488558 [Karstenula rhodostoma CBS 690.94]